MSNKLIDKKKRKPKKATTRTEKLSPEGSLTFMLAFAMRDKDSLAA